MLGGLSLICMHAPTRSVSQKWLTLWLQHCAHPGPKVWQSSKVAAEFGFFVYVESKMRCGISNWRFHGNGLTMQRSGTAAHAHVRICGRDFDVTCHLVHSPSEM